MGGKPRQPCVTNRTVPEPPAISLRQAGRMGITRLRLALWKPADHIEINAPGGVLGPMVKLWSDGNKATGSQNPRRLRLAEFDLNAEEWLPYRPPANGVHRAR